MPTPDEARATHQLLRFADHHPNLVDVTAADMVSWLANPDWSPNTKASNRAALRSFYGWAHSYGHVPVDESRKLPSVKVPPPVPNPAPEAVVKRGLLKSSGNKAWDDAVLKAIDKTAVLPRDIDGTVPSLLEINFRRRD